MGSGKKRQVWKYYAVENGKIKRLRRFCPRCGPGVFLADHGDRLSCGRCGYTEFKKPRKKYELVGKLIQEAKMIR